MVRNEYLFFILLISSCETRLAHLINEKQIIEEYIISYRNGNPGDTMLRAKTLYSEDSTKLKEINFYQKKAYKTVVYLGKDTDELRAYSLRSDNIIYSLKSNKYEKSFCNGKLLEETEYDQHDNILKNIDYDTADQRTLVTQKYSYVFDSEGRKSQETFYWNNELIHEIRFKYSAASLLLEKYFVQNKCCEGNQPIPIDKVVYKYDNNDKLTKQFDIIDKHISRSYKSKNNLYYNSIVLNAYSYDNQNRIISRKIYAPVDADNLISVEKELATGALIVSEEYIYFYKKGN